MASGTSLGLNDRASRDTPRFAASGRARFRIQPRIRETSRTSARRGRGKSKMQSSSSHSRSGARRSSFPLPQDNFQFRSTVGVHSFHHLGKIGNLRGGPFHHPACLKLQQGQTTLRELSNERYYLSRRSRRRSWRNSLIPGTALIDRWRRARSGIAVQVQESRRRAPARAFPQTQKARPGWGFRCTASCAPILDTISEHLRPRCNVSDR